MKKILIVEDETVLRDAYKMVLKFHGYTVSVASNGLEGLEALKKSAPDLILLDFFMPLMDGREFLRNFSKADYPDTRIVMYTNFSESKTKAEMLELGAEKVVLKSALTPLDLVTLIEEMLGVEKV
jgi:CheY-like chemotaxis protein